MKKIAITGAFMSLISLSGITFLYFNELQRISTSFVLTFSGCLFSFIFSSFVLIKTAEKNRRRSNSYSPMAFTGSSFF